MRRKGAITLAEKQLSWTDHHVDLGAKENLRPDFLRFNPKGLVPVMRLGADVIAESTIIIKFIDDRWPSRRFVPTTLWRGPGCGGGQNW